MDSEYKITENKAVQCIKNGNKSVRVQLADSKVEATAVKKWNEMYIKLNWNQIFSKCHRTTVDTKLRWFQLRLLHRILSTNRYLYLCKIKDSSSCTFCRNEEETIIHLLWSCPVVQSFWKKLQNLLQNKCFNCNHLILSEYLVIFSSQDNVTTDKVIDFIILLAKFFIYKCRFKEVEPEIQAFLAFLKIRYADEDYSARIYGEYDKFIKSWIPYQSLF